MGEPQYAEKKTNNNNNNFSNNSQAITETIVLANSLTKRGDVLDLKQLEAVLLEHMEMLQNMRESIQEQQFQDILEFGVELQQESRIWRGITISIARHPTAA
jgi:hypothetical protein